MLRASQTDIDDSGVADREELRRRHGVHLVDAADEGSSVHHLPDGVYGFTHSPAIAAPLFRSFQYRAFEVHRVAGGEVLIVGYVTDSDARRLEEAGEPVTITIYNDREGAAETIVTVPRSRIVKHRQYSVRNTAGVELEIVPVR